MSTSKRSMCPNVDEGCPYELDCAVSGGIGAKPCPMTEWSFDDEIAREIQIKEEART